MLNHYEDVKKAHDENDLLLGTVESWIVYVRPTIASITHPKFTRIPELDWRCQEGPAHLRRHKLI
jgi:hypothetical protein